MMKVSCIEKEHVFDVYDSISDEFDKTRYALWNGVKLFLDHIETGSSILDIGCGNGKYMSYRKDCIIYGCDSCENMVRIAKRRCHTANVIQSNGCDLPYEDEKFDYVMSIGVLHHVGDTEDRIRFVKEMIRVLKKGGKGLLTVWSSNQPKKDNWRSIGGTDYFIPWNNCKLRYYHLFPKEELEYLFSQIENSDIGVEYTYEKDNWYCLIQKSYK